jgi:DnaJ-class molecular chaperone
MGQVDLYESLGVGHGDGALAVRRAYRDLARLSRATTDAVPPFVQKIELAFAVLSDGSRRAHYDRLAEGSRGDVGGLEAEPHGDERGDPGGTRVDLLRDFGGGQPSVEEVWNAFRCNFAPGAEPKSCRVQVLDLHVRMAPPESTAGMLRVDLPVFHACAHCHGTGSIDWCACAACEGTGLAEERSAVRIPAASAEHLLSLERMGVRNPILRLRVTVLA